MKKVSALLAAVLILSSSLACNMSNVFATPTPTASPTPTNTSTPTVTPTPTLTPTPTITPTPEGIISTNPQGEYSLYVPHGYSVTFGKQGSCLVTQDNKAFLRGMTLMYTPFEDAEKGGDLILTLFVGSMLNKFKELGVTAEEKSDTYEISINGMTGQAIDFTGTDGKPMEGQIVAFAPDSGHIFWAMAWVNTSTDADMWKTQGESLFHFILESVTFTP